MEFLLTANDVSKILNVSRALVYKMADRGQLPAIRWDCPGKRQKRMLRFERKDLIDFMRGHKGAAR